MKLRALLTWMILNIAVCSAADPIYRAGQPSSSWKSLLHGEISADYAFSSLKLQDTTEETSSSRLRGMGARALWTPISWLSVGVEGTWFDRENLRESLVDSYKVSRLGGVVKWTVTPDTNPRLYILAGYGRTTHKLDFVRLSGMQWSPVKKSIPYWMLGLGVETAIWKSFFAGIEGNMLWHQNTKLGKYHQISQHAETAFRLRAGVRF